MFFDKSTNEAFLVPNNGLNKFTFPWILLFSLIEESPCKPLPLESLIKKVST